MTWVPELPGREYDADISLLTAGPVSGLTLLELPLPPWHAMAVGGGGWRREAVCSAVCLRSVLSGRVTPL